MIEEKVVSPENEPLVQKEGEVRAEAENFKELFEKSLKRVSENAVVKGKIIRITENEVIVDVGSKSEGVINKAEFLDSNNNLTVSAGDVVNIYLEKAENDKGRMVVSYSKALNIQAWDKVTTAYKEGSPVTGLITGAVKGGFSADIGVKAFLPGSQVDVVPVRNMSEYTGKTFQFKVIRCDRKNLNVLISRKAYLEDEKKQSKEKMLSTLKEGDIIKGKVKSFTSYGAFIDIGGVDALLHNKEITWGKINRPEEALKIGEEIELKVIKFDRENFKISVSLKQLKQNPWESVAQKYPAGSRVKGKVVNILDFGAFVELEPGIEGLIHVSEMSWTRKSLHPSKILSVGDMIEAVVLNVDKENNKLSLGIKQILENPWELFESKHPAGSKLTGVVKNFTSFGVFVEVSDDIDGLVHVGDISWSDSPEVSSLFKSGDTIEVVVLKVDKHNQRISLGIKQLTEDPWKTVSIKYPKDVAVTGKIKKITDKGLIIGIDNNFEGFIPLSECGVERINFRKTFIDGDEVEGVVLNYNSIERRIIMSIKILKDKVDRRELKKAMENSENATTKLSDIFKKVII